MKLRFYKIANVIWLISFLIGGYSTVCLGILRDSFILAPVIICFVFFFLCYGLGLTGLKKEKEHRKDFLFSFIGGAAYFVLCLIYVIKAIISLPYMGLVNTMFPLVAFLLSILQLLATFLAIKKAEGPLFSKDSDDKAIIISDLRKASIEIFYYVVYLLMAVLLGYMGFSQGNQIYSYIVNMGYQRATGYGAYMQYQISSIVVPFVLSVIAFITAFGSYIWFAKDKRGKAGSVFTMITLVSFTSLYGYYLVASFGGIGVFITIVIASTLINKNDEQIQIKGKPLIVIIVVCVCLLAVFAVQEYTIIKDNILNAGQAKNIPFIYYIMQNGVSNYYDYYNYMSGARYNYYGYYGVLNLIGSYSPTYVLFPIVVLAILMKKQTTSKKFLQRVMFTIFFSLLMLGTTSLISSIFNAEFHRTVGAPAEYTGSYITPAIVAHFVVSFIALAAYIIIKAQKPLMIQAEDTVVDNKVEKVTKTRLIIDTIKVPLLVIVSVLFAFVIPIISDNFKQSVTFFSLLNSNDVMSVSDYLLRNTLQWGFLFTAFSLLLYLFFALGFYDKKPKTIQVFEYILCGVQIIMYVALLIMVIVSNTSFNTSLNTLAALPMCFYIIWLLAIIVLNNKTFVLACATKARDYIGKCKNKAAIRKERRQEKAIEAKRRKEEEELRRQEELERQRQLALELEKRRQEEELRRQKEEEERRRNNELHANQQTVMVTPSSDDKIRQIKELLQLREEGAITEEEFLTLKKEIIGGGKNDEEK